MRDGVRQEPSLGCRFGALGRERGLMGWCWVRWRMAGRRIDIFGASWITGSYDGGRVWCCRPSLGPDRGPDVGRMSRA